VELSGQDDVVAASGDGLADDLLRFALGVDVGGVDEVDVGVESAVDGADAVVVVGVAPGPNIIAPRQRLLTVTPVWPRMRYSIWIPVVVLAGRLLGWRAGGLPASASARRAF
jgi:hypothetical protein